MAHFGDFKPLIYLNEKLARGEGASVYPLPQGCTVRVCVTDAWVSHFYVLRKSPHLYVLFTASVEGALRKTTI